MSLVLAEGVRSDRRRGETWSLPQRLKNDLIYRAISVALMLADRLPPRLLLALGRLVGGLVCRLSPSLRRRAEKALELAAVKNPERTAEACFANAGESLMLSLLLRRPSVRASDFLTISPKVASILKSTCARHGGAIFVSAHLGPFELIGPRLAELGCLPVVVTRESYDPRLDPIVDHHRLTRGVSVIHRGEPTAGTRILRALRSGAQVGFLSDLQGSFRSIKVPFLGGSREIPVGPQRLSRLTGVPLIVGTLVRTRQRKPNPLPHFELVLRPTSADDESAHAIAVATALQEAILHRPDDWLWMS